MKPVKKNKLTGKLKALMLRSMPNMITCKEFDDFMVDYLDGELSSAQRNKFELHIRMCKECRQYLDAYKRTIETTKAVHQSEDSVIPNDVPEDLVKAILKARNNQ